MVSVLYYTDVLSSWCLYFEPIWAKLKERFADDPVTFDWRLAVIPPEALPVSREQADSFYRRSGTVMGRTKMLNSGWFERGNPDFIPPNAVAEAARVMGIEGDEARLAISEAGMLHGEHVTHYEVAVRVVAKKCDLNALELEAIARGDHVQERLRGWAQEFDALQVKQRPSVRLVSEIDDRALFSGVMKIEPIAAAIDAMLAEARAYRAYHEKHGRPV